MTLLDRVRAVEDEIGISEGKRKLGGLTVDDLRQDVAQYISFEVVAAIMIDNPQRARNELRNACNQALSDEKWSSYSSVEGRRLTEELIDVVFGMGPIESLIDDETVTEIMVNGCSSIFFERDGKLEKSELHFESDEQVRVLIDRIIGPLGRRIDESSPMVNARLPQGHRVHAVIPPIALDGPHLTIRAHTRKVFTLDEMVKGGSFDESVKIFLEWLIRARKNVCVSGGTGSGKTTLLNAMSCVISPGERIVTIEDSAELKLGPELHVVRLEARPLNAEGQGEVTIRELVVNALRMRPDRIIVGECRSGEAIDMLQAMNTGHDGSLTTLHANSPEDVIDRMTTMVRYALDLPVDVIEAQIGNAFDFVVQVARAKDGHRYLQTIAAVAYDRKLRECSVNRVFGTDGVGKSFWWADSLNAFVGLLQEQSVVSAEEVDRWKMLAYG
jgi:pilus assembly protein CpaF